MIITVTVLEIFSSSTSRCILLVDADVFWGPLFFSLVLFTGESTFVKDGITNLHKQFFVGVSVSP